MRIGNRLFPYPLLNHDKLYSQYKDSYFDLKFSNTYVSENNDFVIENIMYETNSNFLNALISAGKAKAFCVIECAPSMFRKSYPIYDKPQDIIIPVSLLNGKINVNAFAIAMENINDIKSDEFLDDYAEYLFEYEKNDIIAVDDGFNTKIDFDAEEDTKKSSIFEIIKDKNIVDEEMEVDYDANKIWISLPETQWDIYENTKKQKKFEHLYFSIIAIPALTYALSSLQNSGDVDQLCIDYKWFNSFKNQYEILTNKKLDDEEFVKINPLSEAQRILNTPNTKSITDIFDLLVMPKTGGEDND